MKEPILDSLKILSENPTYTDVMCESSLLHSNLPAIKGITMKRDYEKMVRLIKELYEKTDELFLKCIYEKELLS